MPVEQRPVAQEAQFSNAKAMSSLQRFSETALLSPTYPVRTFSIGILPVPDHFTDCETFSGSKRLLIPIRPVSLLRVLLWTRNIDSDFFIGYMVDFD